MSHFRKRKLPGSGWYVALWCLGCTWSVINLFFCSHEVIHHAIANDLQL